MGTLTYKQLNTHDSIVDTKAKEYLSAFIQTLPEP